MINQPLSLNTYPLVARSSRQNQDRKSLIYRSQTSQKGSITLMFCMLLAVLLGAISYSAWVGSQVHEKIKLQNAADLTSLSIANHASTGLNMIAANNIAIAANLHIAAATPMIPRYYALARALLTSPTDYSKELGTWAVNPDQTSYAKLYEPVESLTAHFLSSASGLTELNQALASYWMYAGLPKAMEQLRANEPGSIGVIFQRNASLQSAGNLQKALSLQYSNLQLSSFTDSICHSIKSSQTIPDKRNLASFWLGAPLGTMDQLDSMIEGFQKLERGVQTVVNIMEATREPAHLSAKAAYYSLACGVKYVKKSPHCGVIKKVLRFFEDPVPLPEFTQHCGLNYQGDMAEQAQSFMAMVDTKSHPIGFIYPKVQSLADVAEFEQALDYAVIQAKPTILSEDLQNPADLQQCPEPFKFSLQDQTYCELIRWPENMPLTALSIWNRTQWVIGKARSVYIPDQSQQDPDYAVTHEETLPVDEIIERARMKLFWPVWQTVFSNSQTNPEILRFLTAF